MHGRIEQSLTGKVRARQCIGCPDRERQAHEHAPESDAQAEQQDLPLFGCRHLGPGLSLKWSEAMLLPDRARRTRPEIGKELRAYRRAPAGSERSGIDDGRVAREGKLTYHA